MSTTLQRTTFRTSRLLDFLNEKELVAQTGHRKEAWPLVALKELVDNAIDACEDAGRAPEVEVKVDKAGITVSDNGPGIPVETVKSVLDFSVRVSNREAYVSPTRGAQGNALKTILAMPFVLDGESGRADVVARGVRHEIVVEVDRIRQLPIVNRTEGRAKNVKKGTSVLLQWPDSASLLLTEAKERFLQIASDFTFLNPHLTLTVDWFGERARTKASDRKWPKWLPSKPTSPHWYRPDHLERLIAGYVAHDADRGQDRTLREFVGEFRGLTGSAKGKAVLNETGLPRSNLSALVNGHGLDSEIIGRLLASMQKHSKPVKPAALGIIGKDHLATRFKSLDCEMETFQYRKAAGETDGVPWIAETAFAGCPDAKSRRLITGVNWSPGTINPFRELGHLGQSLDSILEQQRAGRNEPIVFVLHFVCPRVQYTDRGKSAVVVGE